MASFPNWTLSAYYSFTDNVKATARHSLANLRANLISAPVTLTLALGSFMPAFMSSSADARGGGGGHSVSMSAAPARASAPSFAPRSYAAPAARSYAAPAGYRSQPRFMSGGQAQHVSRGATGAYVGSVARGVTAGQAAPRGQVSQRTAVDYGSLRAQTGRGYPGSNAERDAARINTRTVEKDGVRDVQNRAQVAAAAAASNRLQNTITGQNHTAQRDAAAFNKKFNDADNARDLANASRTWPNNQYAGGSTGFGYSAGFTTGFFGGAVIANVGFGSGGVYVSSPAVYATGPAPVVYGSGAQVMDPAAAPVPGVAPADTAVRAAPTAAPAPAADKVATVQPSALGVNVPDPNKITTTAEKGTSGSFVTTVQEVPKNQKSTKSEDQVNLLGNCPPIDPWSNFKDNMWVWLAALAAAAGLGYLAKGLLGSNKSYRKGKKDGASEELKKLEKERAQLEEEKARLAAEAEQPNQNNGNNKNGNNGQGNGQGSNANGQGGGTNNNGQGGTLPAGTTRNGTPTLISNHDPMLKGDVHNEHAPEGKQFETARDRADIEKLAHFRKQQAAESGQQGQQQQALSPDTLAILGAFKTLSEQVTKLADEQKKTNDLISDLGKKLDATNARVDALEKSISETVKAEVERALADAMPKAEEAKVETAATTIAAAPASPASTLTSILAAAKANGSLVVVGNIGDVSGHNNSFIIGDNNQGSTALLGAPANNNQQNDGEKLGDILNNVAQAQETVAEFYKRTKPTPVRPGSTAKRASRGAQRVPRQG